MGVTHFFCWRNYSTTILHPATYWKLVSFCYLQHNGCYIAVDVRYVNRTEPFLHIRRYVFSVFVSCAAVAATDVRRVSDSPGPVTYIL